MQLILLTHPREICKSTNTGQLISHVIPNVMKIIWQRTAPDDRLLRLVTEGETALVYPGENSVSSVGTSKYKNFILIDSTWQEARKIYNRSPYLHELPCIKFSTDRKSRYNLRRNQLDGGLCTAECVVNLLSECGHSEQASSLDKAFISFIAGE